MAFESTRLVSMPFNEERVVKIRVVKAEGLPQLDSSSNPYVKIHALNETGQKVKGWTQETHVFGEKKNTLTPDWNVEFTYQSNKHFSINGVHAFQFFVKDSNKVVGFSALSKDALLGMSRFELLREQDGDTICDVDEHTAWFPLHATNSPANEPVSVPSSTLNKVGRNQDGSPRLGRLQLQISVSRIALPLPPPMIAELETVHDDAEFLPAEDGAAEPPEGEDSERQQAPNQLIVTVVRANNLRNMDRFSVSDPFAMVHCVPSTRHKGIVKYTSTIKNNLNPVWANGTLPEDSYKFTFFVKETPAGDPPPKVYIEVRAYCPRVWQTRAGSHHNRAGSHHNRARSHRNRTTATPPPPHRHPTATPPHRADLPAATRPLLLRDPPLRASAPGPASAPASASASTPAPASAAACSFVTRTRLAPTSSVKPSWRCPSRSGG
jgi:hypothetical protein